MEHRATQADLGIVVRYDNYFRSGESFTKAALFQAKRLYTSDRHGSLYSERDVFQGFDSQQLLPGSAGVDTSGASLRGSLVI